MSPPTTLLDRMRLRLRSRRRRAADLDAAEARALGWQRELLTERAAHGRTRDLIAQTLGILTGPRIEVDVDALVEVVRAVRERARLAERDWALAIRLDLAIEDARRVLRATGHPVGDETTIGKDVDRAIEWERQRRERAELELPAMRGRLDELGDVALLFAPCTCGTRDWFGRVRRDRVRTAPWTCVVDPQCPEHSPGYRFGGRPTRPLALPPGSAAPPSRYGLDALDVWDGAVAPGGWVCDVCRLPVESEPCREHQPNAYEDMRAERDGVPF